MIASQSPGSVDPIVVCVQAGEMAVRDALKDIVSELGPLALDVEEVSTIELVLAEALNNIVEHAYPVPGDDQPIDISCRLRSDGLHVTIQDRGSPMPDGKVPLGQSHDLNVDVMDLPEGGFGWFLIQDLAKDVNYQRHDSMNRLDLRIALALGQTQ
ncbi:MAG: ATP-binding protein [Pseudomonadota bacterium]